MELAPDRDDKHRHVHDRDFQAAIIAVKNAVQASGRIPASQALR
jgi:hypothetical protein